jgi:hypothetical protein
MKKALLLASILIALQSDSQTVFGYWYGFGNVKTKASTNNYLVEMILQPEKGYVKGVLNYYFKNTFRSLKVKGNYNIATRELSLYNIPVTYHGSMTNMEVDCMMNLRATLLAAKASSTLAGQFTSLPEYKYMCPDINFNLILNAGISKKDSVLKAIREFKEAHQVWRPSLEDSLVAANILQRRVVNYVVEKEFKEREIVVNDEIEVDGDTLKVDLYDNGEVDGDSISIFFNKQLLASSLLLSERSIHFDLLLDSTKSVNELSMFADNLGSIPPNTALMMVTAGKNKFELRLTSNLQTNGTIRIKRKKKT